MALLQRDYSAGGDRVVQKIETHKSRHSAKTTQRLSRKKPLSNFWLVDYVLNLHALKEYKAASNNATRVEVCGMAHLARRQNRRGPAQPLTDGPPDARESATHRTRGTHNDTQPDVPRGTATWALHTRHRQKMRMHGPRLSLLYQSSSRSCSRAV